MVGQEIGKYRVTGNIGEGGMGAVYLAEHKLIGRQAAIKVLLPQFSHNQEIVNRFFNEARAASAVRHPGIVEIYDFGYHTDGSAYIVMEYLVGESLEGLMRRLGKLPIDRAVNITRQIMSALSAAHAQGIVHRDLKPDNVFMVGDPDMLGGERAKVLDFGIAKLGSEQSGSVKTRTGAVMGTPTYMAPEQCKGAGRVDHRADLYAVGCILFEMVCGRPPFVAEGGGEVMAQHIYQPPPRPIGFEPSVPPGLEAIIMRLLAKEPDERFQSSEELSLTLRQLPGGGTWPAGQHDATVHGTMAAAMRAGTAPVVGHNTPSPAHYTPSPAHYTPAPAHHTPAPAHHTPPPAHNTPAPQTTLSHAASVSGSYARPPAPARGGAGKWIAIGGIAAVLIAGGIAIALSGGGGSGDDTAANDDSTEVAAAEAEGAEPAGGEPTSAVTAKDVAGDDSADTTDDTPKPPAEVAIAITSEPPGAEIYLLPSESRLGKTPYEGTLPSAIGERVFVLKLSGYEDKTIALAADSAGEHNAILDEVAKPERHTSRRTKPTKKPKTEPKKSEPVADKPPADKPPVKKPPKGSLDPFDKGSGGSSGSLDPFNK